MSNGAPWWVTPIVAIVSAGLMYLANRYTGRSSVNVARVGDETTFRGQLMERVEKLEARLTLVEGTSEARMAFINVLENHIWQGKQPPPPARPPGI